MTTRRDLIDPTDPTDLRPEQRKREVAAILASGVIRMRERQQAVSVGNSRQFRGRTVMPNVAQGLGWVGRGTASSCRRRAAYMSQISP